MNKMRKLLGLGALLLSIFLAGCTTGPAETPVPPSPTSPTATNTPEVAAEVAEVATDTPESQGEPAISASPTPTDAATEQADTDSSTCIACHTSQETLQALAVEPEETESLSEGEG